MIHEISGAKNEKIKLFRSLLNKKNRIQHGLYTVEGIKSVNDAFSSNADISAVIIKKSLFESGFSYPNVSDIYILPDSLFPSLCETDNPQGIMAVIKIKNNEISPLLDKAYIYCDRIQDPGNLGTIIRTADAAGFGGVLISKDSADLFSPKVVRASMGSFFHIPAENNVSENKLLEMQKNGFKIICAVLSDKSISYTDAPFNDPFVLVIGNEANGICDEILDISDIDVKIPITGLAESLNAAVAAGILMYESNRRRRR